MIRIILPAVAATALFAGQASAGPSETVRAVVHVGQVDFNDPAQMQRLHSHIDAVARNLCSSSGPERMFVPAVPDAACVRDVQAQAAQQLGQPQLTAALQTAQR
jgi:UrcA family protein